MSDPKQIDDGGPAFPCEDNNQYYYGMTLRTYAAIKLRVPESGIDWLDDMIRKAQRDELAGQALAGICSQSPLPDTETEAAKIAYLAADAMLAAGKANHSHARKVVQGNAQPSLDKSPPA